MEAVLTRLAHLSQRRPLTPKEFERLQQLLACMRMICGTTCILDPQCRICPKLEEPEQLLPEPLAEPGRKVIVFSEWERMREPCEELGLDAAWRTGTVPQQKRRLEIDRFKRDPGCRILLSTDSGSVGLNLRVAGAVVNLDLTWNPAKLKQRIARAWRKNQRRSIDVINLVTLGRNRARHPGPPRPQAGDRRQTTRGATLLADAERPLRMAVLLVRGGFTDEAPPAPAATIAGLADPLERLLTALRAAAAGSNAC